MRTIPDTSFESRAAGPVDPRDLAPKKLFELTRNLGVADSSVRKWMGLSLGKADMSAAHWLSASSIGRDLKPHLSELPQLTLERTTRSTVDGFEKLLFRTGDGLAVETVLIPLHKTGAVSICLSSQVGCVMGCAFCATARMTSRRSLRTWEIVDQFLQARQLVRHQGRRVTGAVFMGMGEPFLNYEKVLAAAELLCFPLEGAISAKAITISTVGLVAEIDRFTLEERPFRLSISLGAAIDEKRARLVPVAARTPVSDVVAAARRHSEARKVRVNLAYVCISGENVDDEDARALGAIVGDTPVRLDLIDVSDSTGRFKPPSAEELSAFRDSLARHFRQPVVRRYSGGADINAACGTLAGAVEA